MLNEHKTHHSVSRKKGINEPTEKRFTNQYTNKNEAIQTDQTNQTNRNEDSLIENHQVSKKQLSHTIKRNLSPQTIQTSVKRIAGELSKGVLE
jgi:hypothetical protein